MQKFSSQFVKGNTMNDGRTLGWELEVSSLDKEGAIVKLTRS